MFSSSGKFGTAKKTFGSSRLQYIKATMPASLVQGDKINVPITIVNNNFPSSFSLSITELRDKNIFTSKTYTANVDQESQEQLFYTVETNDSHFQKEIQLKITLLSNNKPIDSVTLNSKLLLNGFTEVVSISNVFSSSPIESSSITETLTFPQTIVGKPSLKAVMFSDSMDSILEAIKSMI